MEVPAATKTAAPYLVLLAVLLALLSLSHYWYTLHYFLLNAPDSDDYIDVLWFFEIFLAAQTIPEKIYALFLPIHEHITVMNHLIYLLDYSVLKQINFDHYILAGQVILLGISAVLAAALPSQLPKLLRLALAILLYVNLAYWHSSFWAMTAISNQIVIFFALLTALLAHRYPDKWYWCLLPALASCFSQANGLAILGALAIIPFVYSTQKFSRQMLLPVIGIAALSLLILAFHFIHQNPFDAIHHLDHQALTTEPELIHLYQRDVSGTQGLAFSFANMVSVFLALCGATVLKSDQYPLAIGCGVMLAIFWVVLLAKRRPLDRFTLMALFFVVCSLFLIAAGRGAWAGENPALVAMQSRYRMYSLLLVALSARQLLQMVQCRPAAILALLALSGGLQIGSRHHWAAMEKNQHMLITSYYAWLVDGGLGRSTMPIYPPNQDRRLFIAYDSGRYNPLAAIPEKHLPGALRVIASEQESLCSASADTVPAGTISAFSKKPKAKASELTLAIHSSEWQPGAKTTLLLCGNKDGLLVELGPLQYDREQGQFWPLLLLKTQLPPGDYRAWFKQDTQGGFLGTVHIK